jgi:hypothetical protein
LLWEYSCELLSSSVNTEFKVFNGSNLRRLNQDFNQIWKIFQLIVVKGETYPHPRNTSKEEAFRLWIKEVHKTFICFENNEILGTYYLKQNQVG